MFRFNRSFDEAEFAAITQRIDAIAPLIRSNADAADAAARLPEPVAKAMAVAGLHRLAAPKSVGGGESHPFTQVLAIERVSAIDGAAGWNLMIGIEALGFLSANLPAAQARQLLKDDDVIVAGALNPQGRATLVEGGYLVSGQWPFASGCHNSHYFWGQCILQADGEHARDANGQVQLLEIAVPRKDFEILDTWNVDGLRGSGSHDVRVRDLFVPAAWTTRVGTQRSAESGPLYRMPVYSRLAYNKVGVATGIARAAIEAFRAHAMQKTPRGSTRPLAEREDAHLAVAQAEAALRAARAFVFEAVGDVYETVVDHDTVTPEQRALVILACSNAASEAVRAVGLIHAVAGSTANYRSNPLARCFRDVQVVRQHITVSPQWTAPAGRVLLGLPSQSFMV